MAEQGGNPESVSSFRLPSSKEEAMVLDLTEDQATILKTVVLDVWANTQRTYFDEYEHKPEQAITMSHQEKLSLFEILKKLN